MEVAIWLISGVWPMRAGSAATPRALARTQAPCADRVRRCGLQATRLAGAHTRPPGALRRLRS